VIGIVSKAKAPRGLRDVEDDMETTEPRGINRRLPIEFTNSLIARFWAGVDKAGDDDCWNWTRAFRNGYGAIKHQRRVLQTHCVSFELANGRPPGPKLLVTHSCDNSGCCNPKHLIEGTPKQNNREARERGQERPCGEQIPNAILNEQVVAKIWSLRQTNIGARKIAAQLNLTESQVARIIRGRGWRHLMPAWAK
jgi:hypothetical protein